MERRTTDPRLIWTWPGGAAAPAVSGEMRCQQKASSARRDILAPPVLG